MSGALSEIAMVVMLVMVSGDDYIIGRDDELRRLFNGVFGLMKTILC